MLNNLRNLFRANQTFLFSMLKYGKLCIATQLISIFIGIPLNLLQLYMPKYFVEEVTNNTTPFLAIRWILFLLLGQILFAIYSHISNMISDNSCLKAKLIVKEKTLNHFLSLHISYFDDPERLNKIQRALAYGETGGTSFFMFLFSIINSIASFATITYVSFKFEWWIWLILLALFAIKVMLGDKLKKIVFDYNNNKIIRDRKMNYYSGVLSNKNNLPEIRVFNSSQFFLKKYRDIYLENKQKYVKHHLKVTMYTVLGQFPEKLFDLISYLIIGVRLYSSKATLGDYTLFFSMLTQINMLLNSFKGIINSLTEHGLAAKNYLEFMEDQSETITTTANPKKIQSIEEISFKNVNFRYKKSNDYVLKNINLTIKKGEKVGIVGLNGAGKSTLLKLLLLLYKVEEGEIFVNGLDINTLDLSSLYEQVGVVFQNHNIYSLTFAENIALSEFYDDQKISNCIDFVGLKNKIESFPEKADKPITYSFFKNGIELSGGERQKVAIARLLYKNCDLYVLDEASSALDVRSQNELCELIYNLPKNKTVVFISHRLTDMKLADKVVVLDDGSIIAEGTHTQLLDTCPKYKEMYDMQINSSFSIKETK